MEQLATSFANFWGGGTILLVGLILRFVKGSEGLIAGYNTMNPAEQAKWDAAALRLFLGKTLMFASCILLLGGVLVLLGFYPEVTVVASWGIFIALVLFCVVYVNVSGRFKRR